MDSLANSLKKRLLLLLVPPLLPALLTNLQKATGLLLPVLFRPYQDRFSPPKNMQDLPPCYKYNSCHHTVEYYSCNSFHYFYTLYIVLETHIKYQYIFLLPTWLD